MQEAQKASEEARRRLAEIESRLMKLDVEIGMMRDAAEKEAGAEEARIQAAVQEDARKMVESAQQEIASAAKTARRELTAYRCRSGGRSGAETDSCGRCDRSGAGAEVCRGVGCLRGFRAGKGRALEHGFGRQHLRPGFRRCGSRAGISTQIARLRNCALSPACWPRVQSCGECGRIPRYPQIRSGACWT